MMEELFDSEALTERYIKAERRIAHAEGEASGNDQRQIKVATKLLKRGKDALEDIADITDLPLDKVKELTSSLETSTS